MRSFFDIGSSNDFLHSENDQTYNSIDRMTLTDSPLIPTEFFPSSKKLKIFKESSHLSITTMKLPMINSFVTSDENISKEHLKNKTFPADFLEKYEILETLGKGCQAKVYKIKSKLTNEFFAAKVYNPEDQEAARNILKEVSIISGLKHQNILQLISFLQWEKENIYILLFEFLDYIPLKIYIRKISRENWTLDSYKYIILQIIDGVSYCHEHFVIHGDLNPNNILVSPIDKKVKLIDFGSSKQLSEANSLYSPTGKPKYRPPFEQFFFDDAFKGECWSLGLILMSLFLKETVTTNLEINFAVSIWERIEELGLNICLLDVLRGLITENSQERLDISQVRKLLEKL